MRVFELFEVCERPLFARTQLVAADGLLSDYPANQQLGRHSQGRLLVVVCKYETNCPKSHINSPIKCATHLSVKTALTKIKSSVN
jgi:hypothetical protein